MMNVPPTPQYMDKADLVELHQKLSRFWDYCGSKNNELGRKDVGRVLEAIEGYTNALPGLVEQKIAGPVPFAAGITDAAARANTMDDEMTAVAMITQAIAKVVPANMSLVTIVRGVFGRIYFVSSMPPKDGVALAEEFLREQRSQGLW